MFIASITSLLIGLTASTRGWWHTNYKVLMFGGTVICPLPEARCQKPEALLWRTPSPHKNPPHGSGYPLVVLKPNEKLGFAGYRYYPLRRPLQKPEARCPPSEKNLIFTPIPTMRETTKY